MLETKSYRTGQIVITDGALAGIPDGSYVIQQHAAGWSCLFMGDSLYPVGSADPFTSLELAIDFAQKAIECDELEIASSDRRRVFEPEVFNHIVQRDVETSANTITAPAERVTLEAPLQLVLDLYACAEIPAHLRERILSLLKSSPIAESLLVSEDGSSVRFDPAREAIRIHRKKQERRAGLIRDHMKALMQEMTLLAGSAEEERLTAQRISTEGAPLAESQSLSSGALALGTVNTKLLGLLSDVNSAAFALPPTDTNSNNHALLPNA